MIKTILIVEDEAPIREMLKLLLEQHGFNVIEAKNYAQASEKLLTPNFCLMLLDWMLPGGSGVQLLKKIKLNIETKHIPIIMLTAKHQEDDRLLGLNTGADDYITKPFSNKELIARINAVIRRTYPEHENHHIQLNGLTLDLNAYRVKAGETELKLGPTEFKLLVFFMKNPERVFSRDQLINHVWGHDIYIDDRTIDVHIGRLRKQLETSNHDVMLQTVRGSGYRFSIHQ